MSELIPRFVAGHFHAQAGTTVRDQLNPSDTRDVASRFVPTSTAEVADAVATASAAAPGWRATTGPARADRLYAWGEAIAARAETLAQAITREVGKPIGEARGEVGRAVVICRYYAGEAVRESGEVIPSQAADALQFTVRDPLGPVALITPWNFPLAIPLWKAAPAIAFGNPVLLKPSEHASGVAHALAETALAAGFPAGVFNVLPGDGVTGEALLRQDGVRGISFTGSAAVGSRVAAIGAERNVRTQTEMGGKNVVIVAADGDLDRAAALTAAGAMRYAGQKCTATSRVIVDRRVVEPFLEKLRAAMAALPLGPATDVACAVGPMITAAARDRVLAALAADPAEVLAGGTLPDDAAYAHGHWFAPRLVRFEGTAHPLAQRELFGPVLGLLVADDLEHALVMANETPYGLSASLFTRDLGSAMQYLRRIEVGLVRVNGDTTGVDPHAPFGGLKGSSSGSREQGRAARDFYTEIRTIQIHA
ncbi:MAG: aldehyde dehydrogenase family protein [Gemmatimonadales bacterium]|nr:aldehyde dehydrogenase family protein [Gemmatimonadales bacterium]MBP6570938.1 aldehyde dehydrogenase family protein [Gemmatimonadales bacterium]MBP7622089.1 aldehyde dehydrogenase family protein [Gemmatimonadales bacterium]